MEQVKLRLWKGFERVLSSVASERSRFRRYYVQWKDDKFGRERIATDRFGNNYYQYYSYHGLPTRRIVLYKFVDGNRFHQDPHFIGWLRKNEMIAPTPEQLEQLYLEHDAFVERGIEWDRSELAMISAWDSMKQELDDKYPKERQQIGEVQEWDPKAPKSDLTMESDATVLQEQPVSEEQMELAAISAIDRLEQDYLAEYYLLADKDKSAGKDFNKVAHDEMVRVQHQFSLMRKMEKANFKEQMARKKREETLTVAPAQSATKAIKVNTYNEKHAIKKVEMVNRQMGRSKLERQNLTRKRQEGDRYAMFAEEFGDVFEQIYDESNQQTETAAAQEQEQQQASKL